MTSRLEYANQFIQHGISVIPLRHRGKEPESNLMGGTWEKYKTVLPTQSQVNTWIKPNWQNYGVVMGWKSLMVIDFDDGTQYAIWLDYFRLLNKHITIYETPYIVKSSRGAHVYLRYPPGGANEKRRGIDIKMHGYVVGPGCIHPSGAEYEPVTEFRLTEVYSLDTILPPDLFPKIAPSPSCGQIEALQLDLSTGVYVANSPTEYNAFDMANRAQDMDLITKVKSQVRIESFFSGAIRTSTDGRWFAALCPFHDDHNPSLWIDTRRQICGCNSCGFKPMDVINLYSRLHGLSESAAVSALAREVGVWG